MPEDGVLLPDAETPEGAEVSRGFRHAQRLCFPFPWWSQSKIVT